MASAAREREPGRLGVARASRRAPVEELHHEERGAVLGDVVVDDQHGAGVLHRVRGVPLAEEARPHVLADAELRVEHLHGELGLVPVRRLVDRGHPADAEDASSVYFPLRTVPTRARARIVRGSVASIVIGGPHYIRVAGGGEMGGRG